jgi:hypothetical protein
MITALMLTKSWDNVHAKYRAPEAENIPAHVEEGIADLEQDEIVVEKRALRCDVDFLLRMIPLGAVDGVPGAGELESDSESDTEAGRSDDEFLSNELAGSTSQVSSPVHGFSRTTMTSNAFQRSLLREEGGTPSHCTLQRRAKRRASPSVSLTPSMASRFHKKLRPTQRRNYRV